MNGVDPELLAGVVGSAERLGIELDTEEAARWVHALTVEEAGGDLVVDVESGTFGHRVSMLDVDPDEVGRFRRIADIVGLPDRPPVVLTALALSGSSAQGRVHAFPGDADFFERVHIVAPTREDACRILAEELRAKVLATLVGPTHRLWEVKFGSWPCTVIRGGRELTAGSSVSWTADEAVAGSQQAVRDGAPFTLRWEEAAADPGWCKLDWIVADPARGGLANASNMLDVTWEAPDGRIVALDGAIDPYFQEVYLEPESLPIFSRIVHDMAADSVAAYVGQLEHEVVKYSGEHPNHGKVARRLYNIFRLTGRLAEAAYLRELFDEPTTALYQVAALVRTLDEADRPGAAFDPELLLRQADELIISAIAALDGPAEAEMVRRLSAIRASFAAHESAEDRAAAVAAIQDDAMQAVNDYFEPRLRAVPGIAAYLDGLLAANGGNATG